nr:MAG TPA: zinc-ribbon domain protein [Caudoviricetes sp.]
MQEVRLIDANAAAENADKRYDEWNLAMAAADGSREINMVYKKQELFKAVKKVVESCPSVDPESLRPVAHWENDPNGAGSDVFSCSNCCEWICLEDQGYFPKMDYKFCPYCGARMENVE